MLKQPIGKQDTKTIINWTNKKRWKFNTASPIEQIDVNPFWNETCELMIIWCCLDDIIIIKNYSRNVGWMIWNFTHPPYYFHENVPSRIYLH